MLFLLKRDMSESTTTAIRSLKQPKIKVVPQGYDHKTIASTSPTTSKTVTTHQTGPSSRAFMFSTNNNNQRLPLDVLFYLSRQNRLAVNSSSSLALSPSSFLPTMMPTSGSSTHGHSSDADGATKRHSQHSFDSFHPVVVPHQPIPSKSVSKESKPLVHHHHRLISNTSVDEAADDENQMGNSASTKASSLSASLSLSSVTSSSVASSVVMDGSAASQSCALDSTPPPLSIQPIHNFLLYNGSSLHTASTSNDSNVETQENPFEKANSPVNTDIPPANTNNVLVIEKYKSAKKMVDRKSLGNLKPTVTNVETKSKLSTTSSLVVNSSRGDSTLADSAQEPMGLKKRIGSFVFKKSPLNESKEQTNDGEMTTITKKHSWSSRSFLSRRNSAKLPAKTVESMETLSTEQDTETNESSESLSEGAAGSVDALRNKFLQFIQSSYDQSQSKTKENDQYIKLVFMDFMYDGLQGKISRRLNNIFSILYWVDVFCRTILFKFEKSWYITRDSVIDDVTNKYPYLEYLVEQMIPKQRQTNWMTHFRLFQFLQSLFENYACKCIEKSGENSEVNIEELRKEIQLICDMFYVDLEDNFMVFQAKNFKFIKKWVDDGLKNKSIPNNVIDIWKKHRDYNEKMQKDFKVTAEDFTTPHVIDRDWKFMKYFCADYSPHWNLTYRESGKTLHWNSFADFSADNLNMRIGKIVGYFDYPIEQVAKAFSHDDHLNYLFKNIKWSAYHPINDSNSVQKYPSALMSSIYDWSSLFSSRSVQLVFSTKSSFVSDELVEIQTLFKSYETREKSKKELLKIKMPMLGIRIITKIDNNRTRYVELRFGNLGGLLNSKIVVFNPLSSKKLCLETHNGLCDYLKQAEQEGFPLPSPQDNYLMKLWVEYCAHYAGVDVLRKYRC